MTFWRRRLRSPERWVLRNMTTATKEIRFQAKPGARMSHSQAAQYGPELHRLRRDEQMALTAGNVVDAAAKKRSPLHDFFEWDDSVAGARHRERQAREMMASIVVIEVKGDNGDTAVGEPVRWLVNLVPSDEEGVESEYIPMNVVRQSPDLEQQMLRTAARELSSFRDKYRRLSKLDGILDWRALDDFLESIL